MKKIEITKFTLLGSLYVAQFLPFVFFGQALPIYLRQQGASLESIGALGLLSLPWALKFLWSPYIDRIRLTHYHSYRSWIMFFQCLLGFNLLICAFLDVRSQLFPLLFLVFLGCTIAASQDIATDGLAVTILEPHERGIGNGIQNAGNKLGAIVGGGGMLVLLGAMGWRNSLLTMSASIILLLLPVFRYTEPRPHQTLRTDFTNFQIIWKFLRRPGIKSWLFVLATYMMGTHMASGMLRPLFVDLGLSLGEIGWMLGIVGNATGLVGALIGGVLIDRLGRKRSLIGFAFLQAVAIALCILPVIQISQRPILYFISMTLQFFHAMAGTAIFTIMMDISHKETAGTDFTVQSSIVFLGGIIGIVLGGFIAGSVGYIGAFAMSFAIALAGVWIVSKYLNTGQKFAY